MQRQGVGQTLCDHFLAWDQLQDCQRRINDDAMWMRDLTDRVYNELIQHATRESFLPEITVFCVKDCEQFALFKNCKVGARRRGSSINGLNSGLYRIILQAMFVSNIKAVEVLFQEPTP